MMNPDSEIRVDTVEGGTVEKNTQPEEEEVHPLLKNEVLQTLFSFFKGDTRNLGSFREVCTVWKKAADVEYKESAVWKIGSWVDMGNYQAYKKREDRITKLISSSSSDIFNNFKLRFDHMKLARDRKSPTVREKYRESTERFQEIVCPLIKNLEVEHSGNDHLVYHQHLKFMTNLEELHIEFELPASGSPCDCEVLQIEAQFENLKKVSIVLDYFIHSVTFPHVHNCNFGAASFVSSLHRIVLCGTDGDEN